MANRKAALLLLDRILQATEQKEDMDWGGDITDIGSGKSTLLNLLMGGYDNYHGQILFGSQELRNISRKCLYHLISQIEQNVFIFDSTIQNNITMFKVLMHRKYQISSIK